MKNRPEPTLWVTDTGFALLYSLLILVILLIASR